MRIYWTRCVDSSGGERTAANSWISPLPRRDRRPATPIAAPGRPGPTGWLMVVHTSIWMDARRARELLGRERSRIEEALAHFSRPGREELAGQDEMADSASQLYEEEFDEGQVDGLLAELAAVKKAEERLAAGTFGLSVASGETIPDERLEAVPTAERTIEEQERFDRQAG